MDTQKKELKRERKNASKRQAREKEKVPTTLKLDLKLLQKKQEQHRQATAALISSAPED
jgi:hypothetical protein